MLTIQADLGRRMDGIPDLIRQQMVEALKELGLGKGKEQMMEKESIPPATRNTGISIHPSGSAHSSYGRMDGCYLLIRV